MNNKVLRALYSLWTCKFLHGISNNNNSLDVRRQTQKLSPTLKKPILLRLSVVDILVPVFLLPIIAFSTPARADPQKDANEYFNILKDRFIKAQGNEATKADKDITDILGSLAPSSIPINLTCPAGETANIKITTNVIPWGGTPKIDGAYTWDCKTDCDPNAKTVTMTCNNSVMLNAPSLLPNETSNDPNHFLQIYSDIVFYHEMLHGQLTLTKMREKVAKDTNWVASFCQCHDMNNTVTACMTTQEEDHKVIYPKQFKYAKQLAENATTVYNAPKNFKVLVVTEAVAADARAGTFRVDLPKEIASKMPGLEIKLIGEDSLAVTTYDKKWDRETAQWVVTCTLKQFGFLDKCPSGTARTVVTGGAGQFIVYCIPTSVHIMVDPDSYLGLLEITVIMSNTTGPTTSTTPFATGANTTTITFIAFCIIAAGISLVLYAHSRKKRDHQT